MNNDNQKITLYQEETPVYVDGVKTKFLLNFCADHQLYLLDNPETVLEFIKYTARTAEGRPGMLLHYANDTSEMIIFEADNFL